MMNESVCTVHHLNYSLFRFHIFCRQLSDNVSQKKNIQSPSLHYLEESMSMLGISENHSAIGVRISEKQRSLRQRDKNINYAIDNDGDTLRGVKRRSISRPIKHTPSTAQHSNENEITKSIKKFYMKKTLGRLKNTDLETIYEDTATAVVGNKKIENFATAFGLRKLKRRLTFNTTTTKALKNKRKKRALSILGGGKRFKKVSMQYFLDHLNALNDLHEKEDTNSVEVINISSDGDTSNLDQ